MEKHQKCQCENCENHKGKCGKEATVEIPAMYGKIKMCDQCAKAYRGE